MGELRGGRALLPLLPVGWDLLATWKRRRKPVIRPRILTLFDRLVLRTLVVNLVFVGGLVASFPASVFAALSSRGDWMLAGTEAPWADDARSHLFAAAERLEWLHEATHPNEYEELIDPSLTRTKSDGETRRPGETRRRPRPGSRAEPGAEAEAIKPSSLRRGDGWPFVATLHPAIKSLPPEVETSIESVGKYIADQEPDPILRVKALHDYVADRVAYDGVALRTRQFPPQDAETVFKTRTAVCAGYSTLLAALGKAAGTEIIVVIGDARKEDGEVWGAGHAWNAANVEGRWYLIDVTWDAGHLNGDAFVKDYGTDYLMAPPDAFGLSHMPEDPQWQLRDPAITMGEFVRQPHLRPSFAALDLELLQPTRSHVAVDVTQSLRLRFDNRHGFELHGSVRDVRQTSSHGTRCETNTEGTDMLCRFPKTGHKFIALFGPDGGFLGRVHVDVE